MHLESGISSAKLTWCLGHCLSLWNFQTKGARIIGETDSKISDMGNDVKKSVEDAATEVKKKGKWAFKKATSAVKKSHRGVLIQKGDTLWGLSRQYNVSQYASRYMQRRTMGHTVVRHLTVVQEDLL